MPDIKELVDVAARGADEFVKVYYKLWDTNRTFLNRIYKETSAILWNGNAFSGVGQYSEFFQKLPPTEHEVHAYDSQPLLGPERSEILMTVSGTVKYGSSTPRIFTQRLVLTPDPDPAKEGNWVIGSDCFRFV